jgi:hypothetical protein
LDLYLPRFPPSGSFVTIHFSKVEVLAPWSTPNLEDQGLHFVWPLPFDLSGKILRSCQHSPPRHWGRKLHLHNKAVVREEDTVN